MKGADGERLLDQILDSWDRNNQILLNLVRALPTGGLEARALPTSKTVAEVLTHLHYVRLVFLSEDAPDSAPPVPTREWFKEGDPDRIAAELTASGQAVHAAIER